MLPTKVIQISQRQAAYEEAKSGVSETKPDERRRVSVAVKSAGEGKKISPTSRATDKSHR